MSFRSQDGIVSHPWVRRFGGDRFGLVSLDLFSAVGFLCQTGSRHLRCRLEAKMAGVIPGL